MWASTHSRRVWSARLFGPSRVNTIRQQSSRPVRPAAVQQEESQERPTGRVRGLAKGVPWLIGYTLGTYVVVHIFVEHFYDCTQAYGISMLPTMNSYGDWLVTSKWYRRGRGIQVGDIVSYTHPVLRGTSAVKRVIGMPGDFVLRDTPGKGEGQMIQIPEGHCWVVGDNLTHSRDSRIYGPLPLALVLGKVTGVLELRYWVIPWLRPLPNPLAPSDDD